MAKPIKQAIKFAVVETAVSASYIKNILLIYRNKGLISQKTFLKRSLQLINIELQIQTFLKLF